jgi:hypothetical protein
MSEKRRSTGLPRRQASEQAARASWPGSGIAKITPDGILFRGIHYTCQQAEVEDWFHIARVIGEWRVKCRYQPACIDQIMLFPDEQVPVLVKLTQPDILLAGCSWARAKRLNAARWN